MVGEGVVVEATEAEPTLDRLRGEIEQLDAKLIQLIGQRIHAARLAGRRKRTAGLPAVDPAREAAVVRRAAVRAPSSASEPLVTRGFPRLVTLRIIVRVPELCPGDRIEARVCWVACHPEHTAPFPAFQRSHHDHGHAGDWEHHSHAEHGHSHGFVDESIRRSRAGLRAVTISLGVLALTAVVQAVVYLLSGSVALLADLIHNAGDALTAVPLGLAFLLRSRRAERWAGYAVVLAILASACVALYETVGRLIDPREPGHLWALGAAGVLGFVGNEVAARVRLRAGWRLASPALTADGNHARTDALISLGVVLSAIVLAFGFEVGDSLIGLGITLVILKITHDSWRAIRHS